MRDLHVEVGHWRVRRSLDSEVEYRALPDPTAVGPAHPAVPARDALFSVHSETRTRELLRPEVPLPVVRGGPVAAHKAGSGVEPQRVEPAGAAVPHPVVHPCSGVAVGAPLAPQAEVLSQAEAGNRGELLVREAQARVRRDRRQPSPSSGPPAGAQPSLVGSGGGLEQVPQPLVLQFLAKLPLAPAQRLEAVPQLQGLSGA